MEILLRMKKKLIPQTSKKESISARIAYLDFLKVIAAFFVVFFHFSYYSLDYGFSPNHLYIPNFNRIMMSFSAVSVPLFFLVNGILMFSKEREWKYVYYKAAKILILMVIWRIWGIADWFFKTLFILYIIFPVLQFLLRKKPKILHGLLVVLLVYPFVFNEVIAVSKMLHIQSIAGFDLSKMTFTGLKTMYSIVYFCGGAILEKRKELSSGKSLFLLIVGWGMLVMDCAFMTNANQAMFEGVNASFPTIAALFTTVGLYELARRNIKKSNTFTNFISRGILPIYLLHLGVVLRIQKYYFPNSFFEATIGACLICIVCCAIGEMLRRLPVLCSLVKM